MMYDRKFYYEQGKDFGFGGLPIPDYWQPPVNSWQAQAFRSGYQTGIILRNMKEQGWTLGKTHTTSS